MITPPRAAEWIEPPLSDRVRSDGNWIYGDPQTAAQMVLLHPVGAPMPTLDGWVTPRYGFTLSLHQTGPDVLCMTYHRERVIRAEDAPVRRPPARRRAVRPVQPSLFDDTLLAS